MVEKLHHPSPTPLAAPGRYSAHATRSKWLRGFGASFAAIRDFIYPPMCPLCREETSAAERLCAECWAKTRFIAGPVCPTCGAPVLADGSAVAAICDSCAHAPPAWDRGVAAIIYEGAGRRLVLSLKHGDRLDMVPVAAAWMLRAGRDLVAEADLIAPVPLHWGRMVRRRYNQSGELARAIAHGAGRGDALALDLLRRSRATPTQEGKGRKARFKNVSGAISVSPRGLQMMRDRKVLLIDDVLTTGATLSACTEACRAAGAQDVTILVLARVARGD